MEFLREVILSQKITQKNFFLAQKPKYHCQVGFANTTII